MLISDMETSHLNAMIKFIERKAEDGLMFISGSPGDGDVEYLYGADVLDEFGYRSYLKELKSRGIDHESAYNKQGIGAHVSSTDFYHNTLGHD